MSKASTVYKCKECSNVILKWAGKCQNCGAYSSFEMTVNEEVSNTARKAGLKSAGAVTPVRKAVTISQLKNNPISRTPTGISEFDRVVGGGLVDAEVILFAAFPGSGKSTLSLDIANQYAISGKTVLYSSGEESEQQIGLRAKRMKVTSDNIHIVSETNLETLLGHINELNPELVIVDSLQTIASSEIPGSIGSLQQSKEAAHTLTRIAKQQNITMILISQVIKNGDFSGSESIQHIVDCALMLESDKNTPLKFLRASKNRFGDTNEVGVFQHSETKLEEIIDPSGIFTENSDETVIGSSCSFISEGVRQIPVEIQALVTPSTLPQPRKQFNGVNHQRAQIVCAILDKFCRAKLYENDVFVSTVSGVKVIDPQADLSIAASILSSSRDSSIPSTSAFIGELSLTGQVRGAFMIENKVAEAVRLGFTKIIIPKSAKVNDSKFKNIEIVRISTVKDLPALIKS